MRSVSGLEIQTLYIRLKIDKCKMRPKWKTLLAFLLLLQELTCECSCIEYLDKDISDYVEVASLESGLDNKHAGFLYEVRL